MTFLFRVGFLLSLALTLLCGGELSAKVFESRLLRGAGGAPLCLEIPDRDAKNGQRVQLRACQGEPKQNFLWNERDQSIRSYLGNFCLDLHEALVENDQRIGLWTCSGGDSQGFLYDSDAGLLRFSGGENENFCVTIDHDREGLHLARCDENDEAQIFDYKNAFGDRRLDEVSWVTTHNAHVSQGEASWLFANQSRTLQKQLQDGVRAFMLDTYSFEDDVHLCHGDCKGLKGFAYAEPRQTFEAALTTILAYMQTYPDTIITLFLEDYAKAEDHQAVLNRLGDLRKIIFDPYKEGVREKGWPTLNEMIAANRRLLIVSDKSDKKHLGFGFAQDFTIENYWSIGPFGNKTECQKRWDDIPMDVTYGVMNPLFVMNQFRDVPLGLNASFDNKVPTLIDRIETKCLPAAKRKPSFISVDFYEAADFGVFKTVETLNQSIAILFENDQFTGRAQMLRPGEYTKDQLTLGNDKTTSIRVLRDGAVEAFRDDNFQNWIGRFEVSTANLGPEWNDSISSVRVEYR